MIFLWSLQQCFFFWFLFCGFQVCASVNAEVIFVFGDLHKLALLNLVNLMGLAQVVSLEGLLPSRSKVQHLMGVNCSLGPSDWGFAP
jgi:hypothetical protein